MLFDFNGQVLANIYAGERKVDAAKAHVLATNEARRIAINGPKPARVVH